MKPVQTNAPGSCSRQRYPDVLELLDGRVDGCTKLNASTKLRKVPEEWGRGFSINQVQNGNADSLCTVDFCARLLLSTIETATLCELLLIATAGGSRGGNFTSSVWTNMTTIAFIPKSSPGPQRDR